jgi:GH15 family glucan-1,4-alpha-glucosidase
MGQMLGNFPQTFVHAAFIRAVINYKNALEG